MTARDGIRIVAVMAVLQIDPRAAESAAAALAPNDDATGAAFAPLSLAAWPAAAEAIAALASKVVSAGAVVRDQSRLAAVELRATAAESAAADG